jgi:hypothetical protein
MRDRETIEREIYRAREDLEQRLAELKHLVREKVDVPARARVKYEETKQQALDAAMVAARKAKLAGLYAYHRVKQRPYLTGSIVAAVIAATVTTILLVRHYNRPWYRRLT